jgi:ankyrin repeat protein
MESENIFSACYFSHLDIVKKLLKKGADINSKDGSRMTPLLIAADSTNTDAEFLKFLIKQGAEIKACDKRKRNALILATLIGRSHSGPRERDIGKIRVLLNAGLGIDWADRRGLTPLIIASSYSLLDIMNELLANGADPNLKDENWQTPIMWAASRKLAYGKIKYSSDKESDALAEEVESVMAALISKGADIDAQDKNGKTALMMAAEGGYKEVVVYLIKHQAKINLRDNEGKTAKSYAIENVFPMTAKLISEAGGVV